MTKTRKKRATGSWTMVFLCLCGIYLLSSQTASVSNSASRGAVQAAVTSFLAFSGSELSTPELSRLISAVNNVGRECMHGVVFFVFAFFLHQAFVHSGMQRKKAFVYAFFACLLYGLFDECHQLFVPGRAFQVLDLLMDGAGSLFGMLTSAAVSALLAKRKAKRRTPRAAGAYRPLPARPLRPEGF